MFFLFIINSKNVIYVIYVNSFKNGYINWAYILIGQSTQDKKFGNWERSHYYTDTKEKHVGNDGSNKL